MSVLPTACPYCGQPLLHEDAIAQLSRKEQEIEAEGRRLERELRARATTAARKAARVEIDRKVAAAVAAKTKRAERVLASLDKTKQQLAELRAERQEILRGQKAEIAGFRREAEAQKKGDVREALRRQREGDRAKISREERTKVERNFSQRQRVLERSVTTLEDDKDRLERQVERLRAADQGEFNEDALLELLKAEFRDDDIKRTRRGRAGADIFHRVRYRNGGGEWAQAGLIIYECKDTLRWSNDFVVQAKRAAKTHEAACALLVSGAADPLEEGEDRSDRGSALAMVARNSLAASTKSLAATARAGGVVE